MIKYLVLATILILPLTLGCHDPSVEISREAAQRQAQQNDQMARVTGEATIGARRLVEEHGRARREMAAAQRDLHAERTQLSDGWDDLENERQAIAGARRTESALAAIVQGGGAVLAAILSLGIAWLTLFGLSRQDDASDADCELLIADLADSSSRIGSNVQAVDRLPHPPDAPQLASDAPS